MAPKKRVAARGQAITQTVGRFFKRVPFRGNQTPAALGSAEEADTEGFLVQLSGARLVFEHKQQIEVVEAFARVTAFHEGETGGDAGDGDESGQGGFSPPPVPGRKVFAGADGLRPEAAGQPAFPPEHPAMPPLPPPPDSMANVVAGEGKRKPVPLLCTSSVSGQETARSWHWNFREIFEVPPGTTSIGIQLFADLSLEGRLSLGRVRIPVSRIEDLASPAPNGAEKRAFPLDRGKATELGLGVLQASVMLRRAPRIAQKLRSRPEIGRLRVFVREARGLSAKKPVFVETEIEGVTRRTRAGAAGLEDPVWEEWLELGAFRDLSSDLRIRVLELNQFRAPTVLGAVVVPLASLQQRPWLPSPRKYDYATSNIHVRPPRLVTERSGAPRRGSRELADTVGSFEGSSSWNQSGILKARAAEDSLAPTASTSRLGRGSPPRSNGSSPGKGAAGSVGLDGGGLRKRRVSATKSLETMLSHLPHPPNSTRGGTEWRRDNPGPTPLPALPAPPPAAPSPPTASLASWFQLYPAVAPSVFNRHGQYRAAVPRARHEGFGLPLEGRTLGFLHIDVEMRLSAPLPLLYLRNRPAVAHTLEELPDEDGDLDLSMLCFAAFRKAIIRLSLLQKQRPQWLRFCQDAVRWRGHWAATIGLFAFHAHLTLFAPLSTAPLLLSILVAIVSYFGARQAQQEDVAVWEAKDVQAGPGIQERYKKLVRTTLRIQAVANRVASSLEKLGNLLNWTDPVLTTMCIAGMFLAATALSVVLAAVELRHLLFALGASCFVPRDPEVLAGMRQQVQRWVFPFAVKIWKTKRTLVKKLRPRKATDADDGPQRDKARRRSLLAAILAQKREQYAERLLCSGDSIAAETLGGHEMSGVLYGFSFQERGILTSAELRDFKKAMSRKGVADAGARAILPFEKFEKRWCEAWRRSPRLRAFRMGGGSGEAHDCLIRLDHAGIEDLGSIPNPRSRRAASPQVATLASSSSGSSSFSMGRRRPLAPNHGSASSLSPPPSDAAPEGFAHARDRSPSPPTPTPTPTADAAPSPRTALRKGAMKLFRRPRPPPVPSPARDAEPADAEERSSCLPRTPRRASAEAPPALHLFAVCFPLPFLEAAAPNALAERFPGLATASAPEEETSDFDVDLHIGSPRAASPDTEHEAEAGGYLGIVFGAARLSEKKAWMEALRVIAEPAASEYMQAFLLQEAMDEGVGMDPMAAGLADLGLLGESFMLRHDENYKTNLERFQVATPDGARTRHRHNSFRHQNEEVAKPKERKRDRLALGWGRLWAWLGLDKVLRQFRDAVTDARTAVVECLQNLWERAPDALDLEHRAIAASARVAPAAADFLLSPREAISLRSQLSSVAMAPLVGAQLQVSVLEGRGISAPHDSSVQVLLSMSASRSKGGLSEEAGDMPVVASPAELESKAPPSVFATQPQSNAKWNEVFVFPELRSPAGELLVVLHRRELDSTGRSGGAPPPIIKRLAEATQEGDDNLIGYLRVPLGAGAFRAGAEEWHNLTMLSAGKKRGGADRLSARNTAALKLRLQWL